MISDFRLQITDYRLPIAQLKIDNWQSKIENQFGILNFEVMLPYVRNSTLEIRYSLFKWSFVI